MALGKASAKVLANKGVPVEVYVLKREDGEVMWPPRPALRADESKVTEERFVRLDNLAIADLEDAYDGLDAWQAGLRRKPFATIIKTLEVAWAEEFESYPEALRRKVVGTMLLDAKIDDYATAIGGAFMLANGVEPDAVGKALKQGVAASQKTQAKLLSRLKLDQEVTDIELAGVGDSTTPTPSEDGAEPVEASTSSGD